jgi:GTP-binding protein HflX
VRDISHEQSAEQSQDVNDILSSLGVADGAPLVEIWNKIDLMSDDDRAAMVTQADRTEDLFAVSSITGEGLAALLAALSSKLKDPRSEAKLTLDFVQGRKRAWLFDEGIVTDDKQTDTGFEMTVFWTSLQKDRFARM